MHVQPWNGGSFRRAAPLLALVTLFLLHAAPAAAQCPTYRDRAAEHDRGRQALLDRHLSQCHNCRGTATGNPACHELRQALDALDRPWRAWVRQHRDACPECARAGVGRGPEFAVEDFARAWIRFAQEEQAEKKAREAEGSLGAWADRKLQSLRTALPLLLPIGVAFALGTILFLVAARTARAGLEGRIPPRHAEAALRSLRWCLFLLAPATGLAVSLRFLGTLAPGHFDSIPVLYWVVLVVMTLLFSWFTLTMLAPLLQTLLTHEACLVAARVGRTAGTRRHREPLTSRLARAARRLRGGRRAGSDALPAPACRFACAHPGVVAAVLPDPRGHTLYSASESGSVKAWDLETGRETSTIDLAGTPVAALALTPDGARLFTGGGDGLIRVWDAATGVATGPHLAHGAAVHALALAPDGRRLASGGADGRIRLWDLPDGRVLEPQLAHAEAVHALAFTPDGEWLLSGGADETVRAWEMPAGRDLGVFARHNSSVAAIATTPGAPLAALGVLFGTVVVYDLAAGKQLSAFSARPFGVVRSVALTADGRTVIAGYGARVVLWDLATGRQVADLAGHESDVVSVAASADGRRFYSGGADGTVRVWEAAGRGPTIVAAPGE